ncbi:UNVERIFIED_ORG: hypothetical protein J2W85_004572 [Ensifer adhaerens]|nr:hypothetical protein [Ensifer adhaerens]
MAIAASDEWSLPIGVVCSIHFPQAAMFVEYGV